MSGFDEEREHELAELLREVRAIRATLDELSAGQAARPMLPPNYAVLARTSPELAPDYAVLVRAQQPLLPPDYAVLVRAQQPLLPPDYEVLVRPAIPGDEQSESL